MTTFVYLKNATQLGSQFDPEMAPAFLLRRTRTNFGAEVALIDTETPEATLLSGKEAGTKVTVIAANQRASLHLGTIAPRKYQVLVAVNPDFNAVATVQCPQILEPKEESSLDLVITAHKEVDLSTFEWFIRLYLTE